MYLLDTNVISELRRAKPHGGVLAWLERLRDADIHLCAVTIGEIQAGIEKTRDTNPSRAAELEAWLEKVEGSYSVISVDASAFRTWARLMHRTSDDHLEDAMIAAVALTRGLIVATRNVRDFEAFGVKIVDPFAGI